MRKQLTPSGSSKSNTRKVSVELGEFAFQSLGGEGEGAARASTRLARAIKAYLADRGGNRPGWAYPAHLQEREPRSTVKVELEIEETAFEELTEEAKQRGVSFARMAGHATLYYLAELDAGRLTQRILDDLEESDSTEE